MFVDSFNFKVSTCDMENYVSLSTSERSSKVTPVVSFILSKFWSLPRIVSKLVLHTGLNAYRESSGDSPFVTNFLLVFYKWSQTRSISCTNLIFHVTFIKVCAQYPFKTTRNDDELRYRKALNTNFMIIGNLTKRNFWYRSYDTKKNLWVMLCWHYPINDSSGYFHITVYLAVMLQASWNTAKVTKSQKVHISCHDWLQNFIT